MSADSYAHCEALTRAADHDRWLAGLYAPEGARRHLYALAAFHFEVSHLRDVVRQPMAGEIRLQWWREALEGQRAEEAMANPVADALLETIDQFRLPRRAFVNKIAAHMADLYDDPPATMNDLEGYFGETISAAVQMSAIILADGRDPGSAEAAGHAGVALGIVGALKALGQSAARGQVFLPADLMAANGVTREDVLAQRLGPGLSAALRAFRFHAGEHLSAATALASKLPPPVRRALLALPVAALDLAQLEKRAATPFARDLEAAAWRRQLAMAWAVARGLR